jgi:pectate lyase
VKRLPRTAHTEFESAEGKVTGIDRPRLLGFITRVAATAVIASTSAAFADLSDPNYREGFGKDATGGQGYPTCVVTSSAPSGPGTFVSCFDQRGPGNTAINTNIVFAVSTFTSDRNVYVYRNVTIDGCANGQNGVTFDQGLTQPPNKRTITTMDNSQNIVIRCINFQGAGYPNINTTDPTHRQPEYNFIWLGGMNNATFLIDRCTFVRPTNKSIDITGSDVETTTSNVTVQRSLFYEGGVTSLVKYWHKRNISFHHNVFTHGGERHPQVKGDSVPFDYVNNVVYINAGDVTNYPDGSRVSPYGLRVWNSSRSGSPADGSWGNVSINVVANAFLGDRGTIEVITDLGASDAGVYIGPGNYCAPSSNCAASPRPTPNTIPSAYQVIALPINQLKTQMLPYVGAPNRTALDQQRVDEVAAVLPGSGTVIRGTPPRAPTNLKVR